MNVLVTGGSGFIGSVLANTLSQFGHCVRVFDIIDFAGRHPDIKFFQGDICDEMGVNKALKNVEVVFHCVALVPLMKAGDKFREVNVYGTQVLLNACRQHNIRHVVHLSSSAVFGSPVCPVTANTALKPVEIYGKAKLAGENLVKQYMSEGRPASIVRPRTVLGNFRLGIFHILFEWISENRNIYLIGNGQNLFQFIHVDDLVAAAIQCSTKTESGIYNIGTDAYSTLHNDLSGLIKQAGSLSQIKHLPAIPAIATLNALDKLGLSPLAPWHYLTYHKPFYFDLSHELKSLDWKPKYSNTEMLWSSYQWFIKNKSVLKDTRNESPHHKAPRQGLLKLLKWLS